jgi:GxxExxY protein
VESTLSGEIEATMREIIGSASTCIVNSVRACSRAHFRERCVSSLMPPEYPYEAEKHIPVSYRGHLLCHHRPDLAVVSHVVVEIKAVDRLASVHHAPLLNYLRVSGLRAGLLINFNVAVLRDGIRRIVL